MYTGSCVIPLNGKLINISNTMSTSKVMLAGESNVSMVCKDKKLLRETGQLFLVQINIIVGLC